ncbi:hypothetical protein [Latilactobacillus sakei]|uniref:hypothetical protein n=1 Tax=Latilactobacillus sakei TaxID=1599 RepID=UPI0039B03B22
MRKFRRFIAYFLSLVVVMPIHWLAVAIDFVAYAIGSLCLLIIGAPRLSFSEYMQGWW